MLEILGYAVGLFYATLTLFLAIMHMVRFKELLTLDQKIMFTPIIIVGVLCDVLFRYTLGLILERPHLDKDDMLFTSVLQRHVDADDWKGTVARFMCKTLDRFDPSGKHC